MFGKLESSYVYSDMHGIGEDIVIAIKSPDFIKHTVIEIFLLVWQWL